MHRQGYLFRQLVWLIAVIALPLLALLAYNLRQGAEQSRRTAYQAVENYAAGAAQDVESLLTATDNYLSFLAARPMVVALDPHNCDPLLEGVAKRRQHFANVLVTSLDGKPVCTSITGPGRVPATFADADWFQQASESEAMVLSKPFLAPIAQRKVAAMSKPLRDAARRRIGTVTVLFDLESVQRDWSRYSLPAGSRMTILDRDGTVLVSHPDFDAMVGRDASSVVANAQRDNPSGVGLAIGLDGVERVFAIKAIPAGAWRATASIPASHVFAEYREQRQRSLTVGMLVIVAVLGIAILMARRMSSPLAGMAKTARRVADGDLQARADEAVPGEFHEVAREFNAMLDTHAKFETERQRHADFYTALSRTNGAIVRMGDPLSLYQEICRICVELGHASIAYITLIDQGRAVPVAWAGPAEEFLRHFGISLDASQPDGLSPTAKALRTGRRHISNNYQNDPDTLPWREYALAIGTRSAAAFPFQRGGSPVGSLSLHMTSDGFFDERVVDLIEEMAVDISFALDNFDRDRERMAAVRQSEADHKRFRTLFQTAPVSMTIATVSDHRLLDVNESYGAFTGRSPQELIGRNAFEAGLWPGESERTEFLAQLRDHGNVRNFEMRVTQARGERRDYLLQADIVEFEGVPCMLTIANDITSLRAAQQQLDAREKQISGLVETAMDAIISIDARHRVVLFNRSAAELFQIPAAEALGSNIERFVPTRLHAVHRTHVDEFSRTGSTARRMGGLHTLVGVRADGSEFPIEASISKLGDAESALMTVVIRDATEMKRAEEARLAQASAESASRSKTEFLSRMSHELRTPLNAVLGFSQLLQRDTRERLTSAQHEQVEHIRRAGWHLLALINDVLDVSKIEAGKVDVEDRNVDLHELLDESIRINADSARQQEVHVDAVYLDDPTAHVRADPIRLRQVMINLLSNAIKYNRPQGRVRISLVPQDDHTCVVVADTGIGMNEEQLQHLYEPFNRLGRERDAVEGTGLGLALTRQLVHLMQGSIEVRSEVGIGTEVRVTLRTHFASPSSAQDTASPAPVDDDPSPRGVVLYIEDNAVNLLLVEQLLLRWPDVVLEQAGTGGEGIAAAHRVRPDLILLDMRLPDMDGVKVLQALRETEALRDCCVVALSASAMPEEVKAALEAGASDYWTKPLDFERFLCEMKRLLVAAHAQGRVPS